MSENTSLLREYKFRLEIWRANFWFLPLIIGAASLLLFVLTVALDRRLTEGSIMSAIPFWFAGSPQASRDLLGTIGASIGTITTVVFSISILTLQLASSEYTPKLLRTFTRSTISQVTLGLFIATVAYSILTLSVVREETEGQAPFVPDIAVNVAKLLALASLGSLVYFIGHIAILISPAQIIRSGRKDTLHAYDEFIQDKVGEDAPPAAPHRDGTTSIVRCEESGYLQRIRIPTLVKFASAFSGNGMEIAVRVAVGDHVKGGDTLAEVYTRDGLSDEDVKDARKAFIVGPNRLAETDFRYGIDEFFSIASRRIKQLDTGTAIECVNALIEIWLEMMKRPLYPPDRWIKVREERVHLALAPVDTDEQFAESLRRLQEFGMEQQMLIDLASAIHEGLSTIARESALQGYEATFEKCWPELRWSTVKIIEATDDERILSRVRRALLPLKAVLCRNCPDHWDELASDIRRTAASGTKSDAFTDLLSPTR